MASSAPVTPPLDAYVQKAIDDIKKMKTGGYGQPTTEDIGEFIGTLKAYEPGVFKATCDRKRSPFFFYHKEREWDMYYDPEKGWIAEKDRDS
jgi:hypothetical protein